MVQILNAQIVKTCNSKTPGRKSLKQIAAKIVSKFTDTFQDRCEDIVVAGGYKTH